MRIIIVYHSGYGHTQVVAEHLQLGIKSRIAEVNMLNTSEALAQMDLLHEANTLVFGSPTYMGTVSADFKQFMEETGKFWYAQKWKNKLAAGFTNSSTLNGDKLNTLQQLSLFAAQHSMIWISTGILPQFEHDVALEEPNGLASYLGLMTLSDNQQRTVKVRQGLETAVLFGERIAEVTLQHFSN